MTGADPQLGALTGPDPGEPAAPTGWRRTLALAFAAIFVVGLGWYLYDQRSHVAANYAFRAPVVLAMAALSLLSLALRAVANQRLFGRLGVVASFRDWFAVVTVNSFTNYLPFSAGLVAKAFYLKRVHEVKYRDFAVGQVALLVLIMSANGLLGIAALLWWRPSEADWLFVAFALMAATGSIVLVPEPTARRLARRFSRLPALRPAAIRSAAPGVMLLQVGILFCAAGCLTLGFGTGQAHVGFSACVIFTAAAVVTRLVSITPGAIGVREFLIGGLAVLTGFELQDAVIASTLVRVVEMAVIFALGAVFTFTLSGRVASTYTRPPNDPPSHG